MPFAITKPCSFTPSVRARAPVVNMGGLTWAVDSTRLRSAWPLPTRPATDVGTIIFINPTVNPGRSAGTVLWDGFRIPSQDSVQDSRYGYKAYHSRTKEPNCGNTNYLPKNSCPMRYAEVLLLNAGAAFQLGKTGDATTAFTAVRTRAGLAATTPTLAKIWYECRVELAMEYDRFFDPVRQESV